MLSEALPFFLLLNMGDEMSASTPHCASYGMAPKMDDCLNTMDYIILSLTNRIELFSKELAANSELKVKQTLSLFSMNDYSFPPFHSFPPSFTRQPIEQTRAKQTELWCNLIRDYCRVKRIFWLDVSKARESSLFCNPAIDRRLSDEDIQYFLGQLVGKGDAVWDPDKKRCLVFWRRPSDWGELIYQWVENTGRNGQLLTVHEIRKGNATIGYEFHDLELDTTMRALQALEAIGKCVVVRGDGDEGLGVKFVN